MPVGGDELVRVVIRKEQHEKIAHKIDKMGDYKPEIVFENADVIELDPRDDEADCARERFGRDATCHRQRWGRSADDRGVSVAGGEVAIAASDFAERCASRHAANDEAQ